MNTLNTLKFPLLAALLALSTACDEELYVDDVAEGELAPRGGSGNGTIFNTPVFGVYSLANIAKDFDATAKNSTSTVKILSGTVPFGGNPNHPISRWRVTDESQLVLYVDNSQGSEVKISGTSVIGAEFTLEVTPDADPAFATEVMVMDAECGEFPACSYELVTPLANPNPADYPARTYGGQVVYPICSGTEYQAELGLYQNRVFFARSMTTDVNNPDYLLSPTKFGDSIHCAADALGDVRSQHALDATYYFAINKHTRALADNVQNNAIVMAIAARFDGQNLTEPGKELCLVDTDQGLLETKQVCEALGKLEGIYGASDSLVAGSGLRCRPTEFSHRLLEENQMPTAYNALPTCPGDLVTGLPADATIAVYNVDP